MSVIDMDIWLIIRIHFTALQWFAANSLSTAQLFLCVSPLEVPRPPPLPLLRFRRFFALHTCLLSVVLNHLPVTCQLQPGSTALSPDDRRLMCCQTCVAQHAVSRFATWSATSKYLWPSAMLCILLHISLANMNLIDCQKDP